jgi:hypothetical protein
MTAAGEAEQARDHLAMAEGAAERQELTPADHAAIGQGYATLAVAEAIMHLAGQLPVPGTEQLVQVIADLVTAARDVDGELANMRATVERLG